MTYDYEGNLRVLRRMLKEAEDYNCRYPRIWDVFEDPEISLKGLPVITASRTMDDPASRFVEIRREADGSFKFYSYFDDERKEADSSLNFYSYSDDEFDGRAKESTPEEVAARMENGYGMCPPPDPQQLVERFCSAMKAPLKVILLQEEMNKLERKLLED